jgi:glyoxylase-like metal-dependent hydrolase (beta-lactamase superfamily II)
MRAADVVRVPLGTFVRPGSETVDGRPRAEVVLGYLVPHPAGLLLLDTGIGEADSPSGAEVDAHYRPRRNPLPQALAAAGTSLDAIALVVNCHLHFDHCGGNPMLAGRPVFAQRTELDLARAPDYTLPGLVDFDGVTYEELDGETEILPGVHVLPTPGHTAGHQSLAVECADGTVVLAGQAHDYASDHTAAALARQARLDGVAEPLPVYPQWMDRIAALDPRRVVFAHDLAVWEPA